MRIRIAIPRALILSVLVLLSTTLANAVSAGTNVRRGIGPEGGSVSLAIDPLTPATLNAAPYGAGVFKRTNSGANRTAVNIVLTNPQTSALAIDPVTPMTVYARMPGGRVFSTQQTETTYRTFLPLVRSANRQVHVMIEDDLDEFIGLTQALQPFEELTGIDVVIVGVHGLEATLGVLGEQGNLPDVALIPTLRLTEWLSWAGYSIDLYTMLDPSYLQQQYEPNWLTMATYEGQMAGLWYRASVNSLVWYPAPEFQEAGYHVPHTWDDLLALSDQMVADGRTPWCIGIEDEDRTGWVGTDWVEDIMLRTTTPENYDDWTRGGLKFLSPEVRSAFQTMANIWFEENYVFGGRASIPITFFGDAPDPIFDDPPSCWLHRQGSSITDHFPDGVEFGIDYDCFPLPPIDPQSGDTVHVYGDLFVAFHDRPEVRQFASYVAKGESVRWWVERGRVVSPHKDASLAWYPAASRAYAEMILGADTVRYDASELMPNEVAYAAFPLGIVDYVNGQELDTVLASIDAVWPVRAGQCLVPPTRDVAR